VLRSRGLILALLLAGESAAHAQPKATTNAAPEPPADDVSHELERTDPVWLVSEVVVSGAILGTIFGVSRKAPQSCDWCKSNAFDDAFRVSFLSTTPRRPGVASDMLVGMVPALAAGALVAPALSAGRHDHAVENLAIAASATGIAISLALASKDVIARPRPAEFHGVLDKTIAKGNPDERFVSFYSGHTSAVFAMASSTATLAFMRGYDSAPYIALVGGALGFSTGLLRISADMHWATDALVGATAGTAVGVLLPLFAHPRKKSPVTVVPLVGSVTGLAATGAF